MENKCLSGGYVLFLCAVMICSSALRIDAADGRQTVYIRWSYTVYDRAYSYSGWNIDDIVLTGTGR